MMKELTTGHDSFRSSSQNFTSAEEDDPTADFIEYSVFRKHKNFR
jgi:hypothetical protein